MSKAFARSSLRFSNTSSRSPPSPQLNFRRAFSSNIPPNPPARPKQRLLRAFAVSIAPAAIALSALAFVGPSEVEDINRPPPTLPAGILSSALSLWPSSKLPNPQILLLREKEREKETAENSTHEMSSASTLPGRPGKLTTEEEAKLKELWLVTLKVFGVGAPADSEHTSPPSAAPATPATPAAEEDPDSAISVTSLSPDPRKKNRKSFGRFLGRKSRPEKEAEKKESPVQEIVVNADTSDDKYGHTADFKAALASQTPAELREAFWGMVKCDNPDGLLLRFLRARKWDVEKALVMMVATMNWRSKELNVCSARVTTRDASSKYLPNPVVTGAGHYRKGRGRLRSRCRPGLHQAASNGEELPARLR